MKRLTIKEKRDIRAVFSIFSFLFALPAIKFFPHVISFLLLAASLILILLVIAAPSSLRPLFNIWMKVAHAIGKFNTQLLLLVLFLIVFIPTGFLMRLFGKDPMKRKGTPHGGYWEAYKLTGLDDRSRYERQF